MPGTSDQLVGSKREKPNTEVEDAPRVKRPQDERVATTSETKHDDLLSSPDAQVDLLLSRLEKHSFASPASPSFVNTREALRTLPSKDDDVRRLASFMEKDPDMWKAQVHRLATDLEIELPAEPIYTPLPAIAVTQPREPRAVPLPNQTVRVNEYVKPKTLFDLAQCVRRAGQEKKKLKAIGNGFTFSDVITTDDILINMRAFNGVLRSSSDDLFCHLRPTASPANLYAIGGGATIREANRVLTASGKALLNQTGYDELSVAGTTTVSAHGSSNTLQSLSHQVAALHTVSIGADGRPMFFVVQRKGGPLDLTILNEQNYSAHVQANTRLKLSDFTVRVQEDDELFKAMVVGIGCMGLVIGSLIEVRDAFFIEEKRDMKTWTQVRAALPALLADPKMFSVEVWINPYSENCALIRRINTNKTKESGKRGWGLTSDISSSPLLRGAVTWLSHVPGLRRLIPSTLDSALKATIGQAVLRSFKSLDFGTPNFQKVRVMELHLPSVPDFSNITAIITALKARAAKSDAYITSPFAVRFVKGSDLFMSPQYGRDTYALEFPILTGTAEVEDTLRYISDQGRRLNARQHWGLLCDNFNAQDLQQQYKEFPTFLNLYKQVDPTGCFQNHFTQRMQID